MPGFPGRARPDKVVAINRIQWSRWAGAGSDSKRQAYEYASRQIEYYRPQLLVTELVTDQSKKGQYSRSLINEFMKAAQDHDVTWSLVVRKQRHANKFQEAVNLVERFPELKATLPPKRYWWQTEDQRMIIFEATALALSALEELRRNNVDYE